MNITQYDFTRLHTATLQVSATRIDNQFMNTQLYKAGVQRMYTLDVAGEGECVHIKLYLEKPDGTEDCADGYYEASDAMDINLSVPTPDLPVHYTGKYRVVIESAGGARWEFANRVQVITLTCSDTLRFNLRLSIPTHDFAIPL